MPARTPTLVREVAERGLTWSDLGGGYAELTGGLFRVLVAEIDVIADREDDDMVRLFGHEQEHTPEARRFWAEQVGTTEAMMATHELEDYDEVLRRFAELLSPEQRLAGLAPEQVVRVVGFDQLLPAMPDEVLRQLSDDFIAKLPEPAQSAVRKRLGR